MTRTDAILHAIRRRLEARRVELDAAGDIRGLVLDMKFSPDCLLPREMVDRVERGDGRSRKADVQTSAQRAGGAVNE